MAELVRSAKCGRDWTAKDLSAYNILIVVQDSATFFAQPDLPQPTVHLELLAKLEAEEMVDDENYKLVRYMDLAMNSIPGQESAVIDFALRLFRGTGYENREWDLRSRKTIPLSICGVWMHATANICIVDQNEVLLVFQEVKKHLDAGDPKPQLIAQAIAAFQYNDRRRDILGLSNLKSKDVAGIVMTGTSPTFFKVPVTAELIEAVELGQYPSTPTVVAMHVPYMPPPARVKEGMKPLDNRHRIFACFEAFKRFVFAMGTSPIQSPTQKLSFQPPHKALLPKLSTILEKTSCVWV